jgi:hypothetical protein
MCRQILAKSPNVKILPNPTEWGRVVPIAQTVETSSGFSQLQTPLTLLRLILK